MSVTDTQAPVKTGGRASERSPWVKWYPGDFLHGVADLKPNQLVVYVMVLNLIYDEGGPIVADDERIARRCHLRPSSYREALQALISAGKLSLMEGLLTNARAQKTIETRQKLVANSTQAARARWQNSDEKPNENSEDVMQTQCDRIADAMPYQKPEARSQKNTPSKAKASEGERARKRKTDAHQIADDWRPSEIDRAYAAKEGFGPVAIDRMAERFLNYAKSQGRKCSDWQAAWRNWVLKEKDFNPPKKRVPIW